MLEFSAVFGQTAYMRANYRMQRIFVEEDLAGGAVIPAGKDHVNYLAHVLRMRPGDRVLLFNGRDGEWSAMLSFAAKKKISFEVVEKVRPQPELSDLHYLFAPLKQARLDYTVQKAVEMGAGTLQPVLTHHTQASRVPAHRVYRNAIEAAEQCGILSIPDCREPLKLAQVLEGWDSTRRLVYCDENADTHNPIPILNGVRERKLAILIGPEGGFSDAERTLLNRCEFVTAIPLGPRILRADTAAVAAMSVIQATIGDW